MSVWNISSSYIHALSLLRVGMLQSFNLKKHPPKNIKHIL